MTLEPRLPWLIAHLGAPHTCWSWAVVNGGCAVTDTVAWLFLEVDELRGCADARGFLQARMTAAGLATAAGMMTTRRPAWVRAMASHGALSCDAIVTVGLSNALRAGDPPGEARCSTINTLVRISTPLSESAALEALCLAASARTAAMLESGTVSRVSGRGATGTGTDCIVLASPCGEPEAPYAGMHTAIGSVIGRAVLDATAHGIREWTEENA
ncbi:MAG: adenosylcobinamide amidohydrolase [Bryobacterales bacterium]|nr:adenosylcobinamide amidohydrolase [Bryobacterales bacterium]